MIAPIKRGRLRIGGDYCAGVIVPSLLKLK